MVIKCPCTYTLVFRFFITLPLTKKSVVRERIIKKSRERRAQKNKHTKKAANKFSGEIKFCFQCHECVLISIAYHQKIYISCNWKLSIIKSKIFFECFLEIDVFHFSAVTMRNFHYFYFWPMTDEEGIKSLIFGGFHFPSKCQNNMCDDHERLFFFHLDVVRRRLLIIIIIEGNANKDIFSLACELFF